MMRATPHSPACRYASASRRRGGFTLLEVAVALVIFVIGSVSIIRLFPPALSLIEESSDRSTALGLNGGLLAKLANQPELIPDAIYNDDPGTPFQYKPYSSSQLGSSRLNGSLPTIPIGNAEPEFGQSSLGNYKCVSGERHTTSLSSTYVLARFPFSNLKSYSEDEVEGVKMTTTGDLDFTSATLKSTGASIANLGNPNVPDATHFWVDGSTVADTTFYVTYHWTDASNYVWGVVDEPVHYPSAATPANAPSVKSDATLKPVIGPVVVRVRSLLANVTTASPTGYLSLAAAGATPGSVVGLDYEVLDWRNLVVDSQTTNLNPSTSFATVRLPVGHLDEAQPTYLHAMVDDGSAAVNLVDSNAPTGASVSLQNPLQSTPNTTTRAAERDGTVTFQVDQAKPIRAARVTYRNVDNWTQQVSVACRSYKPVTTATVAASQEVWRDYYLDGATLLFKPSEVGKSVYVTYTYNTGGGDVTLRRRLFTIRNTQTGNPGGSPWSAADLDGNMVAQLILTDNAGGNLGTTQVKAVNEVLGASIQVRTAWISANHYSQTANSSFRGAS